MNVSVESAALPPTLARLEEVGALEAGEVALLRAVRGAYERVAAAVDGVIDRDEAQGAAVLLRDARELLGEVRGSWFLAACCEGTWPTPPHCAERAVRSTKKLKRCLKKLAKHFEVVDDAREV